MNNPYASQNAYCQLGLQQYGRNKAGNAPQGLLGQFSPGAGSHIQQPRSLSDRMSSWLMRLEIRTDRLDLDGKDMDEQEWLRWMSELEEFQKEIDG